MSLGAGTVLMTNFIVLKNAVVEFKPTRSERKPIVYRTMGFLSLWIERTHGTLLPWVDGTTFLEVVYLTVSSMIPSKNDRPTIAMILAMMYVLVLNFLGFVFFNSSCFSTTYICYYKTWNFPSNISSSQNVCLMKRLKSFNQMLGVDKITVQVLL